MIFFRKRPPVLEPDALRIGVVGCGRMGENHCRTIRQSTRAHLAGVYDVNAARGLKIASAYGASVCKTTTELAAQVDAVIIATPTPEHFRLGEFFLKAGKHCLIEKPLAQTPEEADWLIELAEKNSLVLQVGHSERFNAAILAAIPHIREPKFIEVNRLGPYDPRMSHIGVVLDLMIHDLDMVMALNPHPVKSVEAFGAKVLSKHEDIAKVRLIFSNGCVADLSASRVSLERYRKIRIFQSDAYLSIDYAAPSLKIYRRKSEQVESLKDIQILSPRLPKTLPLTAQLDHFVNCVKSGQAPWTSGMHGRNAVELAGEVLRSLKLEW